jgi:prephenate dehydratase
MGQFPTSVTAGASALTQIERKVRSVPDSLTDIRKLIAHPESIDQARAALAEHFGAFTLDPLRKLGKRRILLMAK